jgi:hypothetical protein
MGIEWVSDVDSFQESRTITKIKVSGVLNARDLLNGKKTKIKKG